MMWKSKAAVFLAIVVVSSLAPGAQAQDEWKFGIGTGISSFSLDGDIGFAGPMAGVIFSVDLDNSDTQDLFESGFGLGGYAAKGKWQILFSAGTATLEDTSGLLLASWDRTQIELAGVYNFATTGKHRWGVLVGARNTDHEWTFTTATLTASIDESWTDGLVGITHAVPFAQKWSWANRFDAGFGESEESFLVSSTVNRHFGQHWSVSLNLKVSSTEFGDLAEAGNSDFYLYDVEEPAFGLGFLYHW